VQLLVVRLGAVKQQERVYEQRQVRRDAHVERAVLVQQRRIKVEVLG
jgi:hypothetical protein